MKCEVISGKRRLHPLYTIWKNMRHDRVAEWDDFGVFVSEVGAPSTPSKLMRLDTKLPFSLDNVEWVPVEESSKGVRNPNYKGGMTTTNCKTCGKEFTHIVSRTPVFCSRECRTVGNTRCARCGADTGSTSKKYCTHECWRGEIADRWADRHNASADEYKPKADRCSPRKKIRKLCPTCGKIFSPRSGNRQIYCGRECYGKAISIRQQGEKHHMWKGGVAEIKDFVRRHPLYKQWRKDVFSRDDYTCQSCFVRSGRLHAHHVVAYQYAPKKRLKVSNGVTLCDRCHRLFHSYDKKGVFSGKEALLQKKCMDMFKHAGFYVLNVHGGPMQTAGIPDTVMVFAGRMVCAEYKVFPNFLTPLQNNTRERIQDAGGLYYMIRSLDDAARIIDEIKDVLLPQ